MCAVPVVAVRHRPISALGARLVALQGPQVRVYVRQFGRVVGAVGKQRGWGRAEEQEEGEGVENWDGVRGS